MLLLLAALLFLPAVRSNPKYEWPAVCDANNLATGGWGSTNAHDDHGAQCTLLYDVKLPDKDMPSFCKAMYSDFYVSSAWDATSNKVKCVYKRHYVCSPGQFLIKDKCYELVPAAKSYDEAQKECAAKKMELVENIEKQISDYIIWLYNPIEQKVDTVRYNKTASIALNRRLDTNGEILLPGKMKQTTAADKLPFYCSYYGRRDRSWFFHACKIMKETLKLNAHYNSGMCFVVSPSITVANKRSSADSGNSDVEKSQVQHMHERCKWFTDEDEVTAPHMPYKWTGMREARNINAFSKNSYLLTPSYKAGGDSEPNYYYYFSRSGTVESFGKNSMMWSKNHPMTGNRSYADEELTALVMGNYDDTTNRILAVPGYFRGHSICASGLSKKEVVPSCSAKYGADWDDALRDDGTVMCIKLVQNVDTCHHDKMVEKCKSMNAWIAPVASKEEQNVIMQQLKDHNITANGIWIGATKFGDLSASFKNARFKWDYDESEVIYSNWRAGEPNNAQHRGLEIPHETCLYVDENGEWWDHHCRGQFISGTSVCIKGKSVGFCAKPLVSTGRKPYEP